MLRFLLCRIDRVQVRFKKMCLGLTRLPMVNTPRDLLLASMRVAAEKAKAAKMQVDLYAARSHEGGPMGSILETCRKGYNDVVQTIEETEKIVATQGAQVDLNTQLSSAVTSAGDCDNAFEDFQGMKDPFVAMKKNVWRHVDNVLNIAVVVNQAGHAH